MLKGLPGLVFQGLTLCVFFIFIKKDFKKLFSLANFIGIFLMVTIVGYYYYIYFQYNDLSLVFKTIINESTKRTIQNKPFFESIKHILLFPFNLLFNFLPWTIPFILLFKRENLKKIKSNSFLAYLLFIFIGNIFIYWLSPETVPRYLFMFLPLIFTIGFYLYYLNENEKFKIIFEKALFIISILITVAFLSVPFISIIPKISYLALKLILLISTLSLLSFYIFKNKSEKLILFFSVLLVARIGFDLFVFPTRVVTDPQTGYKNSAILVGNITKGTPLFLYKYSRVDHDISFYIERERMDILKPYYFKAKPNTYYLTDNFDNQLKLESVEIFYTFHTSWENRKIYLVKLKS